MQIGQTPARVDVTGPSPSTATVVNGGPDLAYYVGTAQQAAVPAFSASGAGADGSLAVGASVSLSAAQWFVVPKQLGSAVLDVRPVPSQSSESGSGVILPWQANHAYAAGEAMTQSGNTYTRNTAGTSRPTFDGTEQTFWTVLPTNASVIEQVHIVADAGSAQTLPDPAIGASQTFLTLTADLTLSFPDGEAGASFLVRAKQNGTGGWEIGWPDSVVFLGEEAAPVPAPDAGARTLFKFVFDPDGMWLGEVIGTPAAAVSAYRTAVMALSPISYWRLGESSGTTAVDEVGANAGTYTGGVTLGSDGLIASDSDKAATFDGVDDHVVVKSGRILSGLDHWTVVAWVNLADLSNNPILYGERGSDPAADVLWVTVGSNGFVGINLRDTAHVQNEPYAAVTVVPTNTTVMLAFVKDGSNAKIYANADALTMTNGALTVSNTFTGSDVESWIGNAPHTTGPWSHGAIDELAIFGAALTPEQISDLYDAAQA